MEHLWIGLGTGLTILLIVSRFSCGEDNNNTSVNHDRFLATSQTRNSTCQVDNDCIPSDFLNSSVPPFLISCNTLTGHCECKKCFILVKDVCQFNNKTCERFDLDKKECADNRKSQKKALLFSTFLSATGAANFYIGQNVLGGVQLGLLLLLILFICALICIPCCLFLCLDDEDIYDDITDHFCFVVFIIFSIFAIMILIAIIAGWWITDLFTIVVSGRGDGNGCALYADLL